MTIGQMTVLKLYLAVLEPVTAVLEPVTAVSRVPRVLWQRRGAGWYHAVPSTSAVPEYARWPGTGPSGHVRDHMAISHMEHVSGHM